MVLCAEVTFPEPCQPKVHKSVQSESSDRHMMNVQGYEYGCATQTLQEVSPVAVNAAQISMLDLHKA